MDIIWNITNVFIGKINNAYFAKLTELKLLNSSAYSIIFYMYYYYLPWIVLLK